MNLAKIKKDYSKSFVNTVELKNINYNLYTLHKNIECMSEFDKLKLYMNYYIRQLSLKHNFHIVDADKENWSHGYSTPDIMRGDVAIYYLWKNHRIMTYEQFFSEDNITIIDNGESWKENKQASRMRVEAIGVYDYCSKFKEELEIN